MTAFRSRLSNASSVTIRCPTATYGKPKSNNEAACEKPYLLGDLFGRCFYSSKNFYFNSNNLRKNQFVAFVRNCQYVNVTRICHVWDYAFRRNRHCYHKTRLRAGLKIKIWHNSAKPSSSYFHICNNVRYNVLFVPFALNFVSVRNKHNLPIILNITRRTMNYLLTIF